jgi:hypothetical protein
VGDLEATLDSGEDGGEDEVMEAMVAMAPSGEGGWDGAKINQAGRR